MEESSGLIFQRMFMYKIRLCENTDRTNNRIKKREPLLRLSFGIKHENFILYSANLIKPLR